MLAELMINHMQMPLLVPVPAKVNSATEMTVHLLPLECIKAAVRFVGLIALLIIRLSNDKSRREFKCSRNSNKKQKKNSVS